MNLDAFNYNGGLESGQKGASEVESLIKAMEATHLTGRDLTGTNTAGSALKVESLDPAIKILTNTDKHIKFYKMLKTEKAYNTVEEFNQLVDYGLDGTGIFNGEGQTPSFTDSIYRREAAYVKYSGVAGEVTHPMTLVNLNGISNALAKEALNKTQFLMRGLDTMCPVADSAIVPHQFDGFFKQHYVGVSKDTGVAGAGLEDYFNSSSVVDARGHILSDSMVEDAADGVVNKGFGFISQIVSNPTVFNNYVKQFHESKRVLVGGAGNPAIDGATMGQRVNTIMTQFGAADVVDDIFFDRKVARKYNAGATNDKSPDKPTKDATTPLAAVTDTKTKFGDSAGDYFYAVASVNQYGESAMELLSTSALTVAATEAADLKFAYTNSNGNAASGVVIYRTEKGVTDYATADFFPIFKIAIGALAADYGGSTGVGVVRDRNYFIANTHSALVMDMGIDILGIKQLLPMMRMDLAITSPSFRFMILAYLTPILFTPAKIVRILNIGKLTA